MHPRRLTAFAAFAVPLFALSYGGWAIVTVDDLPAHANTAAPTDLKFVVRQHGEAPLSDLSPTVVATLGNTTITADVRRPIAGSAYTARLNFPRPGNWDVSIKSGFGNVTLDLLPMKVTAGPQTPAPVAAAERGRHLFVAKGCVQCHVHAAAGRPTMYSGMGPELTSMRFEPQYLARFLANPRIKPPTRQGTMPNLSLKEQEIAALVAFVNAERTVTTGKK
jgi:mono/diheme cytochrome c family protein